MQMPNPHKTAFLRELERRVGQVSLLPGGQSLFTLGDDAARIYVRYSKVHEGHRTFFGLRRSDLNQLEGHNSFLCLLVDDGSQPILIPYTDFEEVFRGAPVASDGQHKVQLLFQTVGRELYVARKGRFNVEGFVGFAPLEASIRAAQIRPALNLTHSQVQTLLGAVGTLKGYDVFILASDVERLEFSVAQNFPVRQKLPNQYEAVNSIISEVDVIWLGKGRNSVEALFEVEHSTSIYSGLLRFNDLFLTDSRVARFSIVSDESRRSVFARQLYRPTFRQSGLSELVSFLEYRNVWDWHSRLRSAISRTRGKVDAAFGGL